MAVISSLQRTTFHASYTCLVIAWSAIVQYTAEAEPFLVHVPPLPYPGTRARTVPQAVGRF